MCPKHSFLPPFGTSVNWASWYKSFVKAYTPKLSLLEPSNGAILLGSFPERKPLNLVGSVASSPPPQLAGIFSS